MDPAAATANANSKVLRIGMIVEDRARPSVDQMNAIAAVVDEWRSGVGPTYAPPAPRPDLVDLLRSAERLLADARCSMNDPGLSRSWGQQKRRVRDSILDLLARAS